jgi:hypothetical protein
MLGSTIGSPARRGMIPWIDPDRRSLVFAPDENFLRSRATAPIAHPLIALFPLITRGPAAFLPISGTLQLLVRVAAVLCRAVGSGATAPAA